jgi:hypothetical protein
MIDLAHTRRQVRRDQLAQSDAVDELELDVQAG